MMQPPTAYRLTAVVRRCLLLLSLLALSLAGHATVYYVTSGGAGDQSGLSWANACPTVSDALAYTLPGDEVWVAAGTYNECVFLPSGVALYGGFAGGEPTRDARDWTQNISCLDGTHSGSVVMILSDAMTNTILDGFRLVNGQAMDGGGVYGDPGASPTIRNNTFEWNTAANRGGGISITSGNAVVENNTFLSNTAHDGGGIACIAGAMALIRNNVFRQNVAAWDGGAIMIDNANCEVSQNSLIDNSAYHGGGLFCYMITSPITGNTFRGNVSTGHGAGAYLNNGAPVFTNNLLDGNTAGWGGLGGGVLCYQTAAIVTNNTIISNSAANGGGIHVWESTATITNCIMTNNAPVDFSGGAATYSCIGSGATAGAGNVIGDPQFVSVADRNYRLRTSSPCVNTGSNAAPGAPATDLEGMARPQGVAIDMGAYEFFQVQPRATADSYAIAQGYTLIAQASGVLGNDDDENGDALTAVKLTDPANGILTLHADGGFIYTPNADFAGTDTFTYAASDGVLQSEAATVTIVVNHAPVAVPDAFTTAEDTPLTIAGGNLLANDTDVEGNALTLLSAGPASNMGGTAGNVNGTITYTPAPNFFGEDSFSYTIQDSAGGLGTGVVTVTVTPVSDPPTGAADLYVVTPGSPLTVAAPGVLTNDSDLEGDALTCVLETAPTNGTLTLNADGSFVFTTNPDWPSTNDSFTYRAYDGNTYSDPITVTIRDTVLLVPIEYPTIQAAVNNAVDGDTVQVAAGVYNELVTITNKSINLRGAGAAVTTILGNGRENCLRIGVGVANCSVSGFTFTGSAGFHGFSIYVDAVANGARGVVNIDRCIIRDNSSTWCGSGLYQYHGTLTVTNSLFLRNTSSNFRYGAAVFGGTDFDAIGASIILTNCTIYGNSSGVELGMNSQMSNCIVVNNRASLSDMNASYSGTAMRNFLDGDPLFVDAAANDFRLQVTSPALNNGYNTAPAVTELDLAGNQRIVGHYIDMGAFEVERLPYAPHVTAVTPDTVLNEEAPTVTITGTGFAPGALAMFTHGEQATALMGVTIAPDGTSITGTLNTDIEVGVWQISVENYDAQVSTEPVSLTVNGQSHVVTVSTFAWGGNTFGTTNPTGAQTVEWDGELTVTAIPAPGASVGDWSLDGHPVQAGGESYTLSNVRAAHTLQVLFIKPNAAPTITAPTQITIVEDAPFVCTADNALTIADDDAGETPLLFAISVDHAVLTLGSTAGLTFDFGDGEGDSMMQVNGTVAAINAALDGLTITPDPNYFGEAQLRIVLNDLGNTGTDGEKECTLSIPVTVTAVNDAPVAVDDTTEAPVVRFESTDLPKPILDVSTATSTVTVTDIDRITDIAVDLWLTHTWVGDLRITLRAPNGTEVALYSHSGGSGDGCGTGSLPGQRTVFTDAASQSIDEGVAPYVGEFRPVQPLAAFVGKTGETMNGQWTLAVTDEWGGDTGTLLAWGLSISKAPAALPEGTSLVKPAPGVLGNDTDTEGAPLTAMLVTGPAHGTLVLNGDGSFTYTPHATYVGPDQFTYKANDGELDSNIATVRFNIQGEAPTLTNVTPRALFNAQTATLTLTGTHLHEGAEVVLLKDGNAPIVATDIVLTHTQIVCNVVIPAAAEGAWSVRVTNVDGQAVELPNAVNFYSPLRNLALTCTPASPIRRGSPVTLTASAEGGTNAEYQIAVFYAYNGSKNWAIVKPFDRTTTCTWTPPVIGNYTLTLSARDAGCPIEYAIPDVVTTVKALGTLSTVTLTTDPATTGFVNAPILLTATSNGENTEYKFRIGRRTAQGTEWSDIQDYLLLNTCTWTPTEPGSYILTVWAREADSPLAYDVYTSKTITVTIPPLTAVSLTVSPAAPKVALTPITLSAAATGGRAVEYLFRVGIPVNGALSWTVVQGYSAATTCTWTPTSAGTYTLVVWAREVGSRRSYEVYKSTTYRVLAPAPLTGVTFTTDVAAPQTVGSTITLTANAVGGPAEYQFRVGYRDGATWVWTTIQDHSRANTCQWQPQEARTYTVVVYARTEGRPVGYDVYKSLPFRIVSE